MKYYDRATAHRLITLGVLTYGIGISKDMLGLPADVDLCIDQALKHPELGVQHPLAIEIADNLLARTEES